MTVREMQQDLSANLRTLEKLYQNGRVLTSDPNRPDQFSKSRSKEDKSKDVLQWIALCFMTGDGRKNVSVAFTPGDTSMTFHISSYPNPNQTDVDRTVISEFKAATVNVLEAMKRDVRYDPSSDLDQFRNLAVRHTWPEIRKKIYKIRNPKKYTSSNVHDLLPTFQKHVIAWDAFQKSRPGQTSHTLASTTIIAKPERKTPTDNNVINSYTTLLTTEEPVERPGKNLLHDRSSFMAQMLESCEQIDTSDFMKKSLQPFSEGGDLEWQRLLGHENALFLIDVQKLIRRLRMYTAGMTTFLTDGLKHYFLPAFKRYQDPQSFLQHIHFNWIKYPEHSKVAPLTFPGKPASWITARISSLNSAKVHATSTGKLASLSARAATLWREGDEIHGNVHCEIALISYLVKNNVNIQHNVFGTARAICFACQYFLNRCRSGCSRNFYYDSVAKKIAYDWIVPSVAGAPEEFWEKPCLTSVCERAGQISGTILLSHLKD